MTPPTSAWHEAALLLVGTSVRCSGLSQCTTLTRAHARS
jgi:hypothetical protein